MRRHGPVPGQNPTLPARAAPRAAPSQIYAGLSSWRQHMSFWRATRSSLLAAPPRPPPATPSQMYAALSFWWRRARQPGRCPGAKSPFLLAQAILCTALALALCFFSPRQYRPTKAK
jgi:hypothetical protein